MGRKEIEGPAGALQEARQTPISLGHFQVEQIDLGDAATSMRSVTGRFEALTAIRSTLLGQINRSYSFLIGIRCHHLL